MVVMAIQVTVCEIVVVAAVGMCSRLHPWQQFFRVPTVIRYIFCVLNNVSNRCHPQLEVPANSSNGFALIAVYY